MGKMYQALHNAINDGDGPGRIATIALFMVCLGIVALALVEICAPVQCYYVAHQQRHRTSWNENDWCVYGKKVGSDYSTDGCYDNYEAAAHAIVEHGKDICK